MANTERQPNTGRKLTLPFTSVITLTALAPAPALSSRDVVVTMTGTVPGNNIPVDGLLLTDEVEAALRTNAALVANPGLVLSGARVTSANEITFRMTNLTAVAIPPPAAPDLVFTARGAVFRLTP